MDIVILDIHPNSASYEDRHSFIGKTFKIVKVEKSKKVKGWEGVEFTLHDGFDMYINPAKTVPLVDYPGQKGEEKRKTPYGNLYKRKLRPRTTRT